MDPEYLAELFEPLGAVKVKRMFGGQGVWLDGMMFALVFGDTVYLKVDDETVGAFEAEGSGPFVYSMKGGERQGSLRYYRLPEATGDDPEAVSRWGRLAVDAALRARAPKSKKKKARVDIGPGPWDG
jgi:DNA transformation protein